ncbi:helicase associated domain-containing protein [Streptomyces sp. V4I2]|uniref:helicase associated domain-containing protein n=1 Tax=Streptomyces sp. V4I2 TaxID=3042280 RepID=UPI00359306FD
MGHSTTPPPSSSTNAREEALNIKLGAWIGNQRSRAATLSPERVEQLSNIGMRWT